ncbi:bifunctional DNA-formamidopyrimidine glycosylase/DNA-(apurinic or apyrimidinic site) lyase [Luethyella okanaganae]|uniref:Formamidopyrimidine-DNA glycosylase n=1 Tax=Luethyella okanaganae TaxID=69372 RepID=A0ABW1VB86_9MICO
MPELPEVEVVRAGLAPAVSGSTVSGIEVFDERSLRRHDAASGAFDALLQGQRMLSAVRRGKFLWIPLSSGRALVTHLGMSGQVLLRTPETAESGHLRIRLHLDHPEHGELRVDFVDQRIFGSMAVDRMAPTSDGLSAGYSGRARGAWESLLPSQVSHIARDPIDPGFSEQAFFAALARRRSGIKRALLDQTLVSGIGNIYADEALWAAKVHYEQPASSLSPRKAMAVLGEVRRVFDKALAEGGTSFDAQYVNVNGVSGYFDLQLTAYGRTGRPCPRCGTPIKRVAFMNRSSHFCPRCQRR